MAEMESTLRGLKRLITQMEGKNSVLHKLVRCPECRSNEIIFDYDTNETICGNCGLVLYMPRRPYEKLFAKDEKQKHFHKTCKSNVTIGHLEFFLRGH